MKCMTRLFRLGCDDTSRACTPVSSERFRRGGGKSARPGRSERIRRDGGNPLKFRTRYRDLTDLVRSDRRFRALLEMLPGQQITVTINDAERLRHEGLLVAGGDGYRGWHAEPNAMHRPHEHKSPGGIRKYSAI
jgi:hypothetical protein